MLKLRSALLLCLVLAAQVSPALHAATAGAATAQSPPPPVRNADATRNLAPHELLAELKRGGYVLYFRHTSTDFSQDDSKSRGDGDCANQRNLTNQGRDEFEIVGRVRRDAWQAIDAMR